MDIRKLFNLAGQTALVTGGSSGIGYMIAEGLLSSGVKTYICARKSKELSDAADRLSQFGDCHPLVADLATDEGLEHLTSAILERESGLNILVNNAGKGWTAPLGSFPRSGFERDLSLNLTAPFLLTQQLLPALQAVATSEQPSRVINISSVSGLNPPPRDSFSYSTSKAGLIMLTRHLSERLAEKRITVNAIAPGVFESRMTARLLDPANERYRILPEIPLGRIGCPEDIAGTVIFLASYAGRYVTGETIAVAGGASRGFSG